MLPIRRIGHSIWIAVIVVSFFLLPAQASPIGQSTDDAPASNGAPVGYMPQVIHSERLATNSLAGGSSDILLVETALPWQSDANTQVLAALGYAYDIVDMSNISQVDLFRYPVILIVNDQVQAFYDQYAAQVTAFENYVENGGTLVFFASSDGWAYGTLRANLPGGVSITTPWYENYNFIADTNHPIVNRQLSEGMPLTNEDLFSNYCSHGYFSNLPDNADAVLLESHGYPTLVDYKLGSGRVIASTLTWEHNWKYHTGSDSYGTFARKALDDVFLYAFSAGSVVDGIIRVAPGNVPADGVSTATVTLTDATPGQRVRLTSSRGNVDRFANASGVADAQGRFVTTIRSSTPGTSILTAWDAVTGQRFPATAKVTFTPIDGSPTPIPPDVGDIVITGVEGDCGRIDCPTEGFFMLGFDGLRLPLLVNIDWKGNHPEQVTFSINGFEDSVIDNIQTGARYTLDINRRLHEGANTLRIVAKGGGKESQTHILNLYGYTLPQWIMDGINAVPGIGSLIPEFGSQSLVFEMAFPGSPLCEHESGKSKEECKEFPFGFLPGSLNHFQWQTNIKMTLPTRGGSFELEISRQRDAADTGRKPKAFLKLIGHKFDLEYGGTLSGILGETSPYVIVQELNISGSISGNALHEEVGLVEGLNAIPPLGPIAAQALSAVPPVRDWINDRANLYIDITPELAGQFGLAFQPGFHVAEAQLTLDFPVELGAQADLWAAEAKIYGGLGGKGTLGYSDNSVHIVSVQAYGFGGYMVRVAWFSIEDRGEWKLAGYPSENTQSLLVYSSFANEPLRWSLIPHTVGVEGSVTKDSISAFAADVPAVRAANVLNQSTISGTLVTNVYTYSEPSLAINPTDNALLVWTHDNINKPVGQSHEIRYTLWNGATWSTPTDITNDNLLDGAPQVSWAGNGQGVAVWQRLTSTLAATATLDAATMQKVEIATANYNPTTTSWTPITLLTTNDSLDMAPLLARNPNGGLLAVWRQNQSGQVGGDAAHPDRIMAAFYNNSWGAAQVAVGNVAGLFDLAVGYGNNAATLAFSRYLTPTGSITPSLQLFTSTWNGSAWSVPLQLTDDSLGNSDPQVVYNSTNQPLLIWLAGRELRLGNLSTNQIINLSLPESIGTVDEFQLVRDATDDLVVVFSAQGSPNRDLYLARYDQTHHLWGLSQPLTADPATESYPSPVLDSSGRLLLSYTSTALDFVTKTALSPTTGETVTFTMPTEGQTNLMTLAHEFSNNLSLAEEDFAVSNVSPRPGETLTLSATIHNQGDFAIDSVGLAFYDGDPDTGGTLIGSYTLPNTLAAGMSATLTISYVTPLQLSPRAFVAMADPTNQFVESDENDNRATIAVYSPDLALQELSIHYWGGSDVDLISQIANLGSTASPTTTIAYTQQTVTGTLLVTDVVPLMEAGQAVTLTTPWNYGSLGNGSYQLAAVVNPNGADFAEATFDNNGGTTVLDVAPDLMVNSYYLHSTPLTESSVAFTATIYNIGSQAVNHANIAFYKRGDLANDSLLTAEAIDQLDSGATTEISGVTSGPIGCGLYVVADPDRQISELSRANNVAYVAAENGRCANFNNAPFYAIAPATIVFSNTSTGDNTSWLWNFGDGTTSTEENPSHQYLDRGTYTVTLTVTGDDGADTVAVPNAVRVYQPATANFMANPTTGFAPLNVQFTDQSSGDINAWLWNFGDGTTSDAYEASHTYEQAGTYPVTLTVAGAGGSNTMVRSNYIVVNQPPTPTFTPTATQTPTPTPTHTSTSTPTSTSTSTPTPSQTPTPTNTSTPVVSANLKGIGVTVAAPGSRFIFSGSGFGASRELPVYLSRSTIDVVDAALTPIGTVNTDSNGNLVLTIDTSTNSQVGVYTLAVGDNPRLSTNFTIDKTATLEQPVAQGKLIPMPDVFSQHKVYMPVVIR